MLGKGGECGMPVTLLVLGEMWCLGLVRALQFANNLFYLVLLHYAFCLVGLFFAVLPTHGFNLVGCATSVQGTTCCA